MSLEVRDGRPGVFWMYDAIYDDYAKDIGVYGVAVYGLLCRRANRKGDSWSSLRRMCADLDIARSTLVKTLDTLEQLKLISRYQEKSEYGDYQNTIYTVLDAPGVVRETNHGGSRDEPGVVRETNPKEDTVKGNLYISARVEKCLSLLADLEGYPKDRATNAKHLKKYEEKYPQLDLVRQVEKFCDHYEHSGFKANERPRGKLATWINNAAEWSSNGKSAKAEPKRRAKKVV